MILIFYEEFYRYVNVQEKEQGPKDEKVKTNGAEKK